MKKKNITKEYLAPNNGQKSFYKKAIVTTEYTNGNMVVFTLNSYTIDVARVTYKDGVITFERLWDGYNFTTLKHINSFTNGIFWKIFSKKEWEKIETEKIYNIYDYNTNKFYELNKEVN